MASEQTGYYIGVDIGGTKCAVVVSDDQLNILERAEFATEPERGAYLVFEDLLNLTASLMAKYEDKPIFTIGVSCGGPLDSKKGVVLSPPNLPGWDGIPIVELFQSRFGIETALQNDANAGALAEWMLGAGIGSENVIFLTFGTGLGAGLILNGQLYSGTNDLAGELGHWRLADEGPEAFGKVGSFEAFCSGNGIAKLAKQKVLPILTNGGKVAFCNSIQDIDSITTKLVANAAQSGDELAIEILAESGKRLGQGLSLLIDLLNPEKIIIGSVFARCQSFIHPFSQAVIQQEALISAAEVCQILPARLGDSIGDYASLCIAQYAHKLARRSGPISFNNNNINQ